MLIVCGGCGFENAQSYRFCGQCGVVLNNRCGDCGFENLKGQKFCGNCRKQLLPDESPTLKSSLYTPSPDAASPAPPVGESFTPEAIQEEFPAAHPTPAASTATLPPRASEPAPEPQAVFLHEDISMDELLAPPPPPPPAFEEPVILPQSPVPIFDTPSPQPIQAPPPAPSPAVPEEPEPFESYPLLSTFALASIELMNWPQIAQDLEAQGVTDLDACRQEGFSFVEERIVQAQGTIEAVRNQTIFASFRREADSAASLSKALETTLNILEEKPAIRQMPLKIRVGIDIEQQEQRDSLTSTTERTVASPGTVVVSAKARKWVAETFPLELIGPLRVGNQLRTFYRVLPPPGPGAPSEALPSPTETDAWGVSEAEPPVDDGVSLEVAPEPLLSQEEAPVEIAYTPPVYGVRQAARQANIRHRNTAEVLGREFQQFLSEAPSGRLLALYGEDGLGKTTFIQMARSQADPNPQEPLAFWLGGAAYRGDADNALPLGLWIELAYNFLGVTADSQSPESLQARLEEVFQHFDTGGADVHRFFRRFLGLEALPEVETAPPLEQSWLTFLRLLATDRPVVLVLEDLQYADAASLELLCDLMRKGLLESRVLIVTTATPDFHPVVALEQVLKLSPAKDFVIAPLNPEETQQFLQAGMLASNPTVLPPALFDALATFSRGTPLHLEETLRWFLQQGILRLQGENGVMQADAQALETLQLPPSPEILSQKRFAHLSDMARYLLQVASVVGEKFSIPTVASLAQLPEDQFEPLLQELWNEGWIQPDVMNAARFRHGRLWRIAYESVPEENRRQLHQLAADFLQAQSGVCVLPLLPAVHYLKAQLPHQAFDLLVASGKIAQGVGALTSANMSLFTALSLLEQAHDLEASVREAIQADLRDFLGLLNQNRQTGLALALFQAANAHWEAQQAWSKLAVGLGHVARCHEIQGRIHLALETLDRAIALWQDAPQPELSPEEQALMRATMGMNKLEYLFTLGRLEQGHRWMTEEIEPLGRDAALASQPAFVESYMNARLIKAQILLQQCHNHFFPYLEEVITFADQQRLTGLMIAAKLVRSQGFLHQGNYDGCQRNLHTLLDSIEGLDNAEWFFAQWGLLALGYHCEMGDWENAETLLPNCVYQAELSQDSLLLMTARTYAGRIALGQGHWDKARGILEQTVTESSEYRLAGTALMGWRYLAEAELKMGNAELADEIAHRALEIAQKPDIQHRHEVFLLTNVRAQALLQCGKIGEAGKSLEALWPEAIQTGYTPVIATTAHSIGALYQTMASLQPGSPGEKHRQRAVEFYQKSRDLWREMGNPNAANQVENALKALQ